MLVVGKSGTVMDLPKHVATGLLDSGVVTRVSDEAIAVAALMAPPPGVVLDTPPEGVDGHEPDTAETDAGDGGLKLPPGNGSREVWVEFALANGKTEDDLQGLTQTQIRELFKPVAE